MRAESVCPSASPAPSPCGVLPPPGEDRPEMDADVADGARLLADSSCTLEALRLLLVSASFAASSMAKNPPPAPNPGCSVPTGRGGNVEDAAAAGVKALLPPLVVSGAGGRADCTPASCSMSCRLRRAEAPPPAPPTPVLRRRKRCMAMSSAASGSEGGAGASSTPFRRSARAALPTKAELVPWVSSLAVELEGAPLPGSTSRAGAEDECSTASSCACRLRAWASLKPPPPAAAWAQKASHRAASELDGREPAVRGRRAAASLCLRRAAPCVPPAASACALNAKASPPDPDPLRAESGGPNASRRDGRRGLSAETGRSTCCTAMPSVLCSPPPPPSLAATARSR